MIKVSILILTHNAPRYVDETLKTLNEVTSQDSLDDVEIIVVDNASDTETKSILERLKSVGYIDKLFYSPQNTFFAGGNNLAAKLASNSSKYYLLLNSDVKIKDKFWLKSLLKYKVSSEKYGAVSYGYCTNPSRADGYCFLIDKELYDKYQLDENYQWWWSMTKIQAEIMKEGYSILAIDNHDDIIYHYGGKSGKSFLAAKGMETQRDEILSWFDNSTGKVDVLSLSFKYALINYFKKIYKKIKSIFLKK